MGSDEFRQQRQQRRRDSRDAETQRQQRRRDSRDVETAETQRKMMPDFVVVSLVSKQSRASRTDRPAPFDYPLAGSACELPFSTAGAHFS